MSSPDLDIIEPPLETAGGGPRALDGRSLDVTVVVPVDSPDAEIDQVAKALGDELDREGRTWEIFFVLDGVTTGQAMARITALRQALGDQVKYVSFKTPFGESICLSAAFERSHGKVILTSPQYVQVDPLEVRQMLAAIDAGADFVTPWRHPRVDPILNRAQSVVFNWIIRRIISGPFHDLNCYFRAMRWEVLDDISIYGDMYRFLPVMAHRKGFAVEEVRVRHLKEWGKAGFFGLGVYVRRFLDVLAVMFLSKFTQRPLRFFGVLGGLFSAVGMVICTYLAYMKFFAGEGVAGRPLLLLGVLMIVLGVQVIGFGLVGEIIIFSQARNLREYRIEQIYEGPDPE